MNGHAIVAQLVHLAVGFAFSTLVLAPLGLWVKRVERRLFHQQQRVADSLDPAMPGGVTEMLDRMERRAMNRNLLGGHS